MDKETFIFNSIFFGVVILSFVLGFHMVNNGIEIDTTPLYWPETFPPDPEPLHVDTTIYKDEDITYLEWNSDRIMDKVEMNCGVIEPHIDSIK